MNELISKYWAGESSLEDEAQLKAYLLSDAVAPDHEALIPLFQFFEEQYQLSHEGEVDTTAIINTKATQIDVLVEKYLDADTSLEEETRLREYVSGPDLKPEHSELKAMFDFYSSEQKVGMDKELDTEFIKEPKVRRLWPRVSSVAAAVAVLLAVTVSFFGNEEASYHHKYTELEDPQEALELTKDALAFLSNKYDKGTKSMIHIKELEKTNVFNFKTK